MKKFLAILMALCLLATALCITTSAEESTSELPAPASNVVLRICALKTDGKTLKLIADHTIFEDGWNAAMALARDGSTLRKNDYARIVVDLYADWDATDGQFTEDFNNGPGFDWDAIYFPDSAVVTLNMNGHTIDRKLEVYEKNGEVMCIEENADVIINNGTITGGFSCNGAGGIHIQDEAYVTLNNVNIEGNSVEDDDGAGIAMYDGATLIMNGGSIRDNLGDYWIHGIYSAGIYIEDSTAIFKNVTFQNNQTDYNYHLYGAALYAKNSHVTMTDCKVLDNGILDKSQKFDGSSTIIHATSGSTLIIRNTEFSNNGNFSTYIRSDYGWGSSVIFADGNSDVTIEDNCRFTGNNTVYLLSTEKATLNISDSFFTNNNSNVFSGDCKRSGNLVTRCVFNNNFLPSDNEKKDTYPNTFHFKKSSNPFIFENCELGNSTFNDKTRAKFIDSSTAGSIFGEGSLTMVVSLAALIVSIAAIGVSIASNKKKTTSDTADDE